MAAVDPYALCPCGSGQKFKWCCQKMESYADRAQRLYETGQTEGALEVLNDGLKKEPANAWLLIRKSLILIRTGQPEEAKASLRELLSRQPQHVSAHALLIRCVLETEGPMAGVAQAQTALSAVTEAERKGLGGMIGIVGSLLVRLEHYPAALAHVRLAQSLKFNKENDERLDQLESGLLSTPTVLPWQKEDYTFADAPAGLAADVATRFTEAVDWARAGLWSSAAAAFELLSQDISGPEADRNLGLCRLFLAEDAPAAHYLRLAISKMGISADAVDLEALCQIISPPRSSDKVEHVQLIWPLRNRNGLLTSLREQKDIIEDERGPIDPFDPDSPTVDHFVFLDRAPLAAQSGKDLVSSQIPRVLCRVAVGNEIVALEGDDDGKLDAVKDKLLALAGAAIPPAHPKTKVLGHNSRYSLSLSWEWQPPEEIEAAELRRLTDQEQSRLVREVWPTLKIPYLNYRTPEQAARAGDAEVPLRAAFCQFEYQQQLSKAPIDMPAFRASLNIPSEPAVDPATADIIETLPLARFAYVAVEKLENEALVVYFARAKQNGMPQAAKRAAQELATRRDFIGEQRLVRTVYSDLAAYQEEANGLDAALAVVKEGREIEPAAQRQYNAPAWDMFEVMLKAKALKPEVWVPELAIVLERYRENQNASQIIMLSLMQMGLLQAVPNPDNPGEIMIDPRGLQTLMAEYGPRVTTASGQLGVAASKGEIWTPGASAGGGSSSGGIWTPGGSPPPAAGGDKPKLIIPGR